MNKLLILSAIVTGAVLGIILAVNIVHASDEDQTYVCKHKKHIDTSKDSVLICTIMQDSELFTQKSSAKMYYQLKNDLDTFEILSTTPINESDQ